MSKATEKRIKNRQACHRYYIRHRKQVLANSKRYRESHRRHERVRKHEWYIKHRDAVLAKQKVYQRQRSSAIATF